MHSTHFKQLEEANKELVSTEERLADAWKQLTSQYVLNDSLS